MYERRRAEGVTDRASRGHRHYPARCGVSDPHPQGRGAGVADHGARGGRRGGSRMVRADLSHRAEDCARMAQITASLVVAVVAGMAPLAAQTSLSIYSDGRVVVRRALPQPLEKGRNTLTLKLEGLDPATLFSPDTAVAFVLATARAATVTTDSLRVDSAEVQLVAGSINRARVGAPPTGAWLRRGAVQLSEVVVGGGEAGQEAVGETHVYQLPGRLSLTPGVPVTVALFPASGVAYTQEFVVPGALPWQGFVQQSPAEPNRVPVQVWYTLKRSRGTAFGERPLPGGTVQVFQADSAGRLQLVGEARSDHTAPGRDVRVQSGDAFDVTAERVQTDYGQEPIPPPKRGLPGRP